MSRKPTCITVLTIAILAGCSRQPQAGSAPKTDNSGYVDARQCAPCHFAQAKTFALTGMGRSFSRAVPEKMIEDFRRNSTYTHTASGKQYEFLQRDGKFFLRRTSNDSRSAALEREIHYVVGSGNHARTYLHRTDDGRLLQLPVSWYAEGGGTLAMSPGYDTAAHPDFRRGIREDCFFCHNAYPANAPQQPTHGEARFPGVLPEGIDCQRCHGPGQAHLDAVKDGKPPAEIRGAIVNPKRLDGARELEVCMQCHLETTSFELPNAIHRFGRGVFSYRPGEPLGEYQIHFDHAQGSGHDDKFEIAGAAYRLRQSACFLKSNGALRCTTCHNPHDVPRGQAAQTHYAQACSSCHGSKLEQAVKAGRHTKEADCAGCHMPKRRTEDVVHVAMTDHRIQRRKPSGNLLAPRTERHHKPGEGYRGPVALYYPASLPSAAERDLYVAAAQVTRSANLQQGVPALRKAIEQHKPQGPEFYVELALALAASGDKPRAAAAYRQALGRKPDWLPALRGLGVMQQDVPMLEKARSLDPKDAATLLELGRAYHVGGQTAKAWEMLLAASAADPDSPDICEAMAASQLSRGEIAQAESTYQRALSLDPANARAHFGYASLLAGTGRFPESEQHVEAALRTSPEMAEAQEMRGSLYARRGEWQRAAGHYREALRVNPNFARASLGLGTALAATGDLRGAQIQLARAAADADPAIRGEAAEILNEVNRRLR